MAGMRVFDFPAQANAAVQNQQNSHDKAQQTAEKLRIGLRETIGTAQKLQGRKGKRQADDQQTAQDRAILFLVAESQQKRNAVKNRGIIDVCARK